VPWSNAGASITAQKLLSCSTLLSSWYNNHSSKAGNSVTALQGVIIFHHPRFIFYRAKSKSLKERMFVTSLGENSSVNEATFFTNPKMTFFSWYD
jgi:hypothetical protein